MPVSNKPDAKDEGFHSAVTLSKNDLDPRSDTAHAPIVSSNNAPFFVQQHKKSKLLGIFWYCYCASVSISFFIVKSLLT